MKLCAHHVVIVSSYYANARTALPVPDPDGLVVGSTENPRILVMEHSGSDVVQVTEQGEDAPSLLVVPHFDFVIIAAGNEQRLLIVKTYTPNGPVVLVELVEQGAHTIVP